MGQKRQIFCQTSDEPQRTCFDTKLRIYKNWEMKFNSMMISQYVIPVAEKGFIHNIFPLHQFKTWESNNWFFE